MLNSRDDVLFWSEDGSLVGLSFRGGVDTRERLLGLPAGSVSFQNISSPSVGQCFFFPAFSPNPCLRWFVLLLLLHVFVSPVYRLALRRRVVRAFVPCTAQGEGG